MNKKVSLLILSIALAIGIFVISTYIQKKAVNYVPTISCLIVNKDIEEYNSVSKEDIKQVEMPISIVANLRVVRNYEDVSELFLKDKIYKGQLLLLDQFDNKSNLMLFSGEDGKEKLSVKIRASENGASYIIKPGSLINVYATLNNDYVENGIFKEAEKMVIGNSNSGYSIVKMLSGVKVLGTFDENGDEIENTDERAIDTVLLLVSQEEAMKINLIREIAVFNITEI